MASIRKRGDTFTITAYLGYDENNKQRKKTTTYKPPEGVTAGKAEKLAKAFAAQWEDSVKGYVALDENKTFAELAQWYYTDIAPSVIKASTLKKAQTDLQNHVMNRLGHEKLKNITPAMLDRLFRDLQTNNNLEVMFRLKDLHTFDDIKRCAFCEQAGVSTATLHRCLRGERLYRPSAEKIAAALHMRVEQVFEDATPSAALAGSTVNKLKLNVSAIFTAAVKKEILRRNPCLLATPPKVETKPAAFMDEQQCRQFLSALHEQPDFQLEVMLNTFLATGLRSGEMFALHWEDIDFSTGVLHVRHTLIRLNGEYVRQSPKTGTSTRNIKLPTYILEMLIAHREKQDEAKAAAETWIAPQAVFTNQQGNYICASSINDKLKTVLHIAGLPDNLHLHSLRHTHASLLINSDIAAKIVAGRLGHATTKTTLNIYSHIFAESEARATQALEMKLFGTDK